MEVLRTIERVAVDRNDRPTGEVRIVRCGDYDVLEKIAANVISAEDGAMRSDLRKRRRAAASVVQKNFSIPATSAKKSAENEAKNRNFVEKSAENGGSAEESSENELGVRDFAEMSEAEKRFFLLRKKSREEARETKKEVLAEYRRVNGKLTISKKNGLKPGPSDETPKKSAEIKTGPGAMASVRRGRKANSGDYVGSQKVVTAADAEAIYEKAERASGGADDHSFAAYLRQVDRLGAASAAEGQVSGDGVGGQRRLVSRDDIDVARTVKDRPEKVAQMAKEIEDAYFGNKYIFGDFLK